MRYRNIRKKSPFERRIQKDLRGTKILRNSFAWNLITFLPFLRVLLVSDFRIFSDFVFSFLHFIAIQVEGVSGKTSTLSWTKQKSCSTLTLIKRFFSATKKGPLKRRTKTLDYKTHKYFAPSIVKKTQKSSHWTNRKKRKNKKKVGRKAPDR